MKCVLKSIMNEIENVPVNNLRINKLSNIDTDVPCNIIHAVDGIVKDDIKIISHITYDEITLNIIDRLGTTGIGSIISYDPSTNITTMSHDKNDIKYEFNANNQLIHVISNTKEEWYKYDDKSRLIEFRNKDDEYVKYTYDDMGRLTNVEKQLLCKVACAKGCELAKAKFVMKKNRN